MNKFLTVVTVLAVSVFYSCGNGGDAPKNDSLAQVEAAKKLYLDKIIEAENQMRASKTFDSKLALDALRAYNDFCVKYPNDSLTPEYLFKASDIAQGTGNYQQAAVYLETILENHLNYPKYPDACFAAAFVYDSYLENVGNGADRAAELYDFIIKNYPNSSYAEQSKVLKEYIGKPDSVLYNDVRRKADSSAKKK
jgi:TolA-binding protein